MIDDDVPSVDAVPLFVAWLQSRGAVVTVTRDQIEIDTRQCRDVDPRILDLLGDFALCYGNEIAAALAADRVRH